jgi:hypothetical protein
MVGVWVSVGVRVMVGVFVIVGVLVGVKVRVGVCVGGDVGKRVRVAVGVASGVVIKAMRHVASEKIPKQRIRIPPMAMGVRCLFFVSMLLIPKTIGLLRFVC